MYPDDCPGGCGRRLIRGRFVCVTCFHRLPQDLQGRVRRREATAEEVRAALGPAGPLRDAWRARPILPDTKHEWPEADRGF